MHGTIKKLKPSSDSPFARTAQNSGFIFDVDECLVQSTIREIEPWKQHILWSLHDLTGGAVVLATNSDLTSIDKMLKGFPCIAEHASVFRMEEHGNIDIISPPLDTTTIATEAASVIEQSGLYSVIQPGQSLKDDLPIIKVEAKMASVALVFPVPNPESAERNKTFAQSVLGDLNTKFNFCATHDIIPGKDACEIVPKGFAKVNGLEKIMVHPNFADRDLYIFGDSEPDNLLMKAAFNQARGRGYAVGHSIADAPHITKRIKDINAVWKLLENEERSLRLYNRLSL